MGRRRCGPRARRSARSVPAADRRRRHAAELRDHHVPLRGVPRRRRASRRSRSRRPSRTTSAGVTSRSTRWRSRSPPTGGPPALVDPLRRRRRPRPRPAAHAAGAGDQLRRRPAADAARRPLHRPLRPEAGAGAGRRRGRRRGIRLAIVSAERIRDELDKLITLDHPARRAVVLRRHRPRRALPARAAGTAPRARPDPSPQGRAQPHDRRRRERAPARRRVVRLPHHPSRRAVPRRRQAADPRLPAGQGHDVPPPRRGRGAHDAQADGGAALLDGRHRRGVRAGGPAPALPHLQDGVERLGGAPLRARRRRRCSPS